MTKGTRTVTMSCGPFGCAVSILGLILIFFILTHIPEIWTLLERAIR